MGMGNDVAVGKGVGGGIGVMVAVAVGVGIGVIVGRADRLICIFEQITRLKIGKINAK